MEYWIKENNGHCATHLQRAQDGNVCHRTTVIGAVYLMGTSDIIGPYVFSTPAFALYIRNMDASYALDGTSKYAYRKKISFCILVVYGG